MRASRYIASALAGFVWAATASGQTGAAVPLEGQPAIPVSPATPSPSATSVLTTPPGAATYPPGTVHSPACPGGLCCGPVGANGPVTYELYGRTGPSLVVGGSEFSGRLNTGWQVGGGAHTFFFNTSRDAAWVLNTGISYTYNRGRQERGGPLEVQTPPPSPQVQPDGIQSFLVRGLHRTSFDFGFGRDWWITGPGTVESESHSNSRWGVDVGGRWGTSHVDLVPTANLNNYLRKRSIFHTVLIGSHADWERPMGNWILFAGVRGEFEYTFLNVVPPNGSDIVGLNFLFQMGVRY
jgi:hypothetical protein